MLLERLGRSLHEFALSDPPTARDPLLDGVPGVAPVPDCGLPTGAEKDHRLVAFTTANGEDLGHSCSPRAVDHALGAQRAPSPHTMTSALCWCSVMCANGTPLETRLSGRARRPRTGPTSQNQADIGQRTRFAAIPRLTAEELRPCCGGIADTAYTDA